MENKRKYEKPFLKAEEFNVIDYISGCSVLTTVSMSLNCGEPPEDNIDMLDLYYVFPEVFTTECEIDFDTFDYLSYCYHTPTGASVVLTS